MSVSKFALVTAAFLAILTSTAAQAASHRRAGHLAHHRHGGRHHVYALDNAEGSYTRSDDRIYGGAYYGFFTDPRYGRFQGY